MTSMAPNALRTSRIATEAMLFLPAWAVAPAYSSAAARVPLQPPKRFFCSFRSNHVAADCEKASAIRSRALMLWWGFRSGRSTGYPIDLAR